MILDIVVRLSSMVVAAIEVLTVVTHPSNPSQRIAPDRYFAEVAVRQRIEVIVKNLALT